MELFEYLRIVKKGGKTILLCGVVLALIAFVYSWQRDSYYDTSLALSISRANTQQTQDYQYDGYYVIQASELFADTAKQWINSPEIVINVYQEAEIALEEENLRSLSKKFKANKLSSQYIDVRFKTETLEEAEKLSTSLLSVLQSKAHMLSWASRTQASFSILGADPIIILNKTNLLLNTFLGLLIGLFLGVSLVFFKYSCHPEFDSGSI